MARPIWKGTISFGLVNVPVELYPAEQSHQLSFSMLDKRDFCPVGYKRYNKNTGKEVTWNDIVKGYEYEKDQYVVLSDEDFRRANVQGRPDGRHRDVRRRARAFRRNIFETPYYLVAGRARQEGVRAAARDAARRRARSASGRSSSARRSTWPPSCRSARC